MRQIGRLRSRRRWVFIGAAMAAAVAVQVSVAGSASAAVIVSQSAGTFLDGSGGAVNLNTIAALNPASAEQPDGPASATASINATVLNAVNVDLGSGIHLLGGAGLLALGTVNQVAVANADGSSSAGSGAVDNTGAISVGSATTYPSNATISLTPALAQGGTVVTTALSAAGLTTGALSGHAAQAAGNGGAQTGTYNIANLHLTATSPLLSGVGSTLTTAFGATGTLQTTVNGLTALIRALPAVGPLATVTGLPNLATVLSTAIGTGDVSAAGGAIHANLTTGVITVDVAALLTFGGADLNNLAPNTDVLALVTNALTADLLPAITTELTAITTAVNAAFAGIAVSVLGVPVLAAVFNAVVTPVLNSVVAQINTVSTGVAGTVITPLISGLDTLLAVHANSQTTTAGTFRESALTVGIIPGTPLASLRLASASVGPNLGPQPPTITGINPNTGPTTGGQGVTVTGTGFIVGGTSITIGGNVVPAAQVTVTGTTSLTFVTPAHAAGPVNVTATTTVGTSGPLTYTYVTTPPGTIAAPVITSPANGSSTTNPHVPVVGTGIAGDTVTVTEGGTTVCTATVGTNGTWTCSPAAGFALGAHTISATQTDGSAVSPASTAVTFTVTSAGLIAAPVITSPQNGSTVTDPNTPVNGTGVVGDTVTVTEGGTTVCTALVGSNGTWTCSPAAGFALGAHTIVASQTDGSTISPDSAAVTFTVVAPTQLASTGSPTGTGLLLAGLCLLIGLLSLVLARVRGRRTIAGVESIATGVAEQHRTTNRSGDQQYSAGNTDTQVIFSDRNNDEDKTDSSRNGDRNSARQWTIALTRRYASRFVVAFNAPHRAKLQMQGQLRPTLARIAHQMADSVVNTRHRFIFSRTSPS